MTMSLIASATATAARAGAEPHFVSTARLAELLDCNPRTLARLARRGLIPAPIDLGGLRRWDFQAVLTAIQAR